MLETTFQTPQTTGIIVDGTEIGVALSQHFITNHLLAELSGISHENRHIPLLSPRGNVPSCLTEWIKIGCPSWILNGIKHSFPINLTSTPIQGKPYYLPLNTEKRIWIAVKLLDYIVRKNLVKSQTIPHLTSPFLTVDKPGSKKFHPKFKTETLEDIQKALILQETREMTDCFIKNATTWNGRFFDLQENLIYIDSDSSTSGFSCTLNGEKILQELSSQPEREEHINTKELLAIQRALELWMIELRNQSLHIRTDNQVAFFYLKKAGGRIPHLNFIARNNICIQKISWVPTDQHCFPDALSRSFDAIECEISTKLFEEINKTFGPLDRNRFDSDRNKTLNRFISLNRTLGRTAEGIDALSQIWSGLLSYACPLLNLISRTIDLIVNQKADTFLTIPVWKNQIWYQRAMNLASKSQDLIFSPQNCFGVKGIAPEVLKNQK